MAALEGRMREVFHASAFPHRGYVSEILKRPSLALGVVLQG